MRVRGTGVPPGFAWDGSGSHLAVIAEDLP